MWSNVLDRISFFSLYLVIVLLPVFVLPFTQIPAQISKSLLMVVGLSISIIFWAVARFSDGKVSFPNSPVILSGLGVSLAFLLSAFFSEASQMSFFGTMFDLGTFWFIFTCFLLMFACSVMLGNRKSAKMVLFGVLISTGVVIAFQVLRFFWPDVFSLGIMSTVDKSDNLLGSWSSFGLFSGLASLVSILVIEFFSLTRGAKWAFAFLMVLSLVMVSAVNSPFIWGLLGVSALIVFVYKMSSFSAPVTGQEGEAKVHRIFPGFSFAVVMLSLLFFMSGQFFGSLLPQRLGIDNTEVSPSLGATMSVAKQVLKQDPVFGIGPNRFSEAWALYKPEGINNTIFWNVNFSSGSGTIPTFLATTGVLGILAWIAFFFTFIVAGIRYVFRNSENSAHKEITLFFVLAFYLFVASFFFVTGQVLLVLAFAFVGIFIGLVTANHRDKEISIMFLDDHRKSFFFILSLVAIMILAAAMAFKFIERFASVAYFNQAVSAEEIPQAEEKAGRALSLYANDLYLRTYSQVYLLKLGSIVNQENELSDDDKALLQTTFEQAVSGAQLAVNYNPKNYVNLQTLGSVYSTAGSLGVEGAYDQAIETYKQAQTLNPLNPGIDLAIAQVYFASKNNKDAKEHANKALVLKANYIDALILLSQIARSEGNTQSAISYAEQALAISPSNADLIEYLNTLKSGSSN